MWNTRRNVPQLSYMTDFSVIYGRRFGQGWSLVTVLFLTPFLFPSWAPGQQATTSSEKDRLGALFDRVLANQKQSEVELDQYERIQRYESRKMGEDTVPADTKTWRLFPVGTGVDKLTAAQDGKPLSPESSRNELENLEKYLVWVAQDGSGQKRAYAKADHKRKERFDLIDATRRAFIFTPDGTETRQGRKLLRFTMTPNPKFRPNSRYETLFAKVRGTVWIDEQSSQLAKIEGTVTQDISLALFLAKVYKGSHFMQERYEVLPGIWEPTFEQYDFDGRKYLLPYSIHERSYYSSYKRVGPPKEAIEVVRAELSKLGVEASSH